MEKDTQKIEEQVEKISIDGDSTKEQVKLSKEEEAKLKKIREEKLLAVFSKLEDKMAEKDMERMERCSIF